MLRRLVRAALAAVLLLAPVAAEAATVTLQWDANTEPDVIGYVVRYGTTSGVYSTEIDVGLTTTWTTAFTAPGTATYYFVVQAYNSSTRSDNSAEVSATISNPLPHPIVFIDHPSASSVLPSDFLISGWAADLGALSGPGVDTLHVYAYPSTGGSTFLGVASYGALRGDVGAAIGAQFQNSGYSLPITGLAPGSYTIAVYAHSTVTNTFAAVQTLPITVSATPPIAGTLVAVDIPTAEQTITGALWVAGWAVDLRSTTGTGVSQVVVWAYPWPRSGTAPIFLGAAQYGIARSDVGSGLGARFTNSGYSLITSGLPDGQYAIVIQARNTVTNGLDVSRVVEVTNQPAVTIMIDSPAANATVGSAFNVDGWAIDRRATVASGTSGIDLIHIYASPNPGSGQPSIFLGVGSPVARPDVAAIVGSQYAMCGYHLAASGVAPGVYDVLVYAHSSITGAWENVQRVRVTVQ